MTQIDLLDVAPSVPVSERKPIVDFWLMAIEAEQGPLPAGWRIFKWEALMDRDNNTLLTGAVAPPKLSGKNKGYPNWSKRDKATERTFVVSTAARRAAEAHHEVTTGDCSACHGNGTAWCGWSREEGSRYRHCKRCNGTGVAPKAEAAHG